MPTDREVIIAVEVVRALLDAAFQYAQTRNIKKEDLAEAWLESYAKIDELNPKDLPKIGDV